MSKTAIIFLLTYFGGAAAAIIAEAAYGIYLYELLYFLNPAIRWWHGGLPVIRYSFIVAIVILIGYFIRKDKYSENRLFDVPQTKWLLSLTIVMGLVSFIAAWPERHQEIYSNHVKVVLFVALAYKIIDTPPKFEKLIWAFLIGQFYLGWVAHFTGRDYTGRLEGVGPADSGGDSNAMGAVLITAVPILVFYLIEGKKIWQKIAAAIVLAFVMDGIILVNSRGAFLGLLGSLLYFSYFIFFKSIKNIQFKLKMAGGLIVGILLFIYLTDASFWDRMSTITNIEQTETAEGEEVLSEGASRTYFWKKGLELVQSYPFGVGGWGYMYLSPQFIPKEMLSRGRGQMGGLRAAHSTWIQALTEYGYVGFILFLGYLISNFNLMRKVRRFFMSNRDYYLYYQGISITAGFVAFLGAATFIDQLYIEMMYWFPAFMACFANIYWIKIEKQKDLIGD